MGATGGLGVKQRKSGVVDEPEWVENRICVCVCVCGGGGGGGGGGS